MEVPLPPVQTTETHQSQLLSVTSEERLHPVGLISDASSAPPCLDRTPNIYSIAPSQAVTTSRSHALTSDTTVHTQLHTVMRTSGMDHHTHDLASVNHAVHYPGGLLSLTNLNLEVGLDKTHPHLQQVNLLMGSNMPLASVELSNPILNSGLIDRTSLEHNSITHETSSAPCPYNTDFHDHNDPEVCGAISCGASVGIPQMKDNHLHRDSTCNLIPTQLSVDGHALPPSMTEIGNELPGPESSSEHSHQVSVQDHDAENKDLDSLVETLACYRCKVCPFISFSKEGVEQHLRSTHLKFLEPCTELKLPGVNASKVSALETSTVQEQQSVDHNKPTADAIPAPVTSNCKDDTYICGVCEKGFPDIESCGVHMAVEHNLPVDHVQLEPLPTTTSVAVLQQPLITTPQHRSSDLPPIRPTLLPKMSSNKEQHLLTTSQQPPQPPPPPPPPPLPPPSVVPPQDNTVSKSVKKRKPKRTLRENGENDANVGVSFKKPKVVFRLSSTTSKDAKFFCKFIFTSRSVRSPSL